METVAAIVPPLVMAAIFIAVAVTAFRATDRAGRHEPDRPANGASGGGPVESGRGRTTVSGPGTTGISPDADAPDPGPQDGDSDGTDESGRP